MLEELGSIDAPLEVIVVPKKTASPERSEKPFIDLQNDYFPGGKFPLWNTETVFRTSSKPSRRRPLKAFP